MTTGMILLIVGFVSVILFIAIAVDSSDKRKRENARKIQAELATAASGKCPFCGGDIPAGVKKCKHCGEWIDASQRRKSEEVVRAQLWTGSAAKLIGGLIVLSIIAYLLGLFR